MPWGLSCEGGSWRAGQRKHVGQLSPSGRRRGQALAFAIGRLGWASGVGDEMWDVIEAELSPSGKSRHVGHGGAYERAGHQHGRITHLDCAVGEYCTYARVYARHIEHKQGLRLCTEPATGTYYTSSIVDPNSAVAQPPSPAKLTTLTLDTSSEHLISGDFFQPPWYQQSITLTYYVSSL